MAFNEKVFSVTIIVLLLASTLTLAFNIQPVKASGTIYIRADGSIEPSTVPIQQDGDLYTLTGNITDYDGGIVVERNNIILDGANHIIGGSEPDFYYGVTLVGRENVTIKNLIITLGFMSTCIYLNSSSNNFILANDLTSDFRYGQGLILDYSSNNVISGNNMTGGVCLWLRSSSNNLVSGNNMVGSYYYGVDMVDSNFNTFSANNIQNNNNNGLALDSSSNNSIIGNNITNNGYGISLGGSNNSVYHNNFVDNSQQADSDSTNLWDDGYPSGGNYWSDYMGADLYKNPYQNETGSDGMGDTSYVINADNQDRFPLMHPWSPLPVRNMNTGLGYATIQEAINAASEGDTIFVKAGTYYENVIINKKVSLVGEDRGTTIIDGSGNGNVVCMTSAAGTANISSFTL